MALEEDGSIPKEEGQKPAGVSVEDIAEKLGWNPNWEGPEDDKITATDYIMNQQKILRQSSTDISSLKSNLESIQSQMKDMSVNHTKQVTQALKAQKERLLEERSKAVEEGDKASFDKLDKQINDIDIPADAPTQTSVDNKAAEIAQRERQFAKESEWYGKPGGTNIRMTAAAQQYANVIMGQNPEIAVEDLFTQIEEAIKEEFPDRFASPTNKPTQVSGDRPKGNSSTKTPNWDKMIEEFPEAQAEEEFQALVKRGSYKPEDKEKFAKEVLA